MILPGDKIAKARHMLKVDKRSVTEVAFSLGFLSSQHFATVFRKFTGQVPSATRRMVNPIRWQ